MVDASASPDCSIGPSRIEVEPDRDRHGDDGRPEDAALVVAGRERAVEQQRQEGRPQGRGRSRGAAGAICSTRTAGRTSPRPNASWATSVRVDRHQQHRSGIGHQGRAARPRAGRSRGPPARAAPTSAARSAGRAASCRGSSSATRGAWPSALAKFRAETRPALQRRGEELVGEAVDLLEDRRPQHRQRQHRHRPEPRVGEGRPRRGPCAGGGRTGGAAAPPGRGADHDAPRGGLDADPAAGRRRSPTMIPRLNAMPTAAGPAKRPWICSIAVKSAENPCRARAGAMIRISSAQIAARSGSRWKSAAGASGQIAHEGRHQHQQDAHPAGQRRDEPPGAVLAARPRARSGTPG